MAGLVADYNSESEDENSSSSSAESEDTHSEEHENDVTIDKTQEKLPLPDILNEKSHSLRTEIGPVMNDTNSSSSSVFFNPFKAKEEEKLAILEKHVKLTDQKDQTKTEKTKFRRPKRVQSRQNFDSRKGNEDDDGFKTFGKRRIGLSDSLVPPKKALQAYEKQRRDEQRT